MHIRAAPSLIVSIANLSSRVAVHVVARTWLVEAIVPVASFVVLDLWKKELKNAFFLT